MEKRKSVHIIGGGTIYHVRPHMALCAPAYGKVVDQIMTHCYQQKANNMLSVFTHKTKLANGGFGDLETNEDVSRLLDELIEDPTTKIIFMPVALCDFEGEVIRDAFSEAGEPGKYGTRLKTRHKNGYPKSYTMTLTPASKLIGKVRKTRKDIFLVAFKTTCGATEQEQYLAGLNLLKEASCNLVLANDTKTRLNMVITPEEAKYHVTTDRKTALKGLVEMAYLRSHLTFTQSTVVAGEAIAWDSQEVPASLRTVVDHCVKRGAYKPFRGATVGHFAAKLADDTFLTSKRKTNFNYIAKNGLVKIKTDGPDTVLAYGAKPSVGGQSQRIVFKDHPGMDCIVHFHCPIKTGSKVPTVSQREYECGSHECGKNTSKGLTKFGNLFAVFLDQHGPNILFNKSINPQEIIDFIEANFDLEGKTGGYVT